MSALSSRSSSMAEITVKGLNFHYQHLGKGRGDERLVVFLHGLVMDNLSSWYFTVANPVAQQAEVLLYDLRGHGKSDRPEGGYTVAEQIDDLIALLDALGLSDRPLELVGNSFGGLLATAFTLRHPERVRGLTLIDAQVHDEAWAEEMRSSLGLEGDDLKEAIATNFQHWLGRHSERKRNRLAKNAAELVYETSLVRDLGASPAPLTSDIANIQAPVRALYGENSDVRVRGEELAAMLKSCELTLHAGCTHSVLWEETTVVREAILTWTTRGLEEVREG
jgi:pimeloyl-ACP methyl ester carboxylesterase